MTQDNDPYRGNLEAATNRADALAQDLEAEKRETDRLRAELAEQKRSKQPAKRPKGIKDPPPSSPTDLDQDGNPKLFDDAASPLGGARTWYGLYLPVFGALLTSPAWLSGRAPAYTMAMAITVAVVWIAGMIHPTIAGPRTRRWITGAPFAVAGLFGLFDDRPSDRRHTGFLVIVWFVDPKQPPARGDVATLLSRGPLDISVVDQPPDGTVKLRAESRRRTDSRWGENRLILRGALHLIDSALLPLHETRPIARIEFRDRT